jgi:hypothetical protein
VGHESEQRKIHWIAWDKLLLPKAYGGMEFRDLRLFNQALLARQAWRLLQYPKNLCTQLLRAKCYPRGNLMDTAFPMDALPTWRTIEHGLDPIKKVLFGAWDRVLKFKFGVTHGFHVHRHERLVSRRGGLGG